MKDLAAPIPVGFDYLLYLHLKQTPLVTNDLSSSLNELRERWLVDVKEGDLIEVYDVKVSHSQKRIHIFI